MKQIQPQTNHTKTTHIKMGFPGVFGECERCIEPQYVIRKRLYAVFQTLFSRFLVEGGGKTPSPQQLRFTCFDVLLVSIFHLFSTPGLQGCSKEKPPKGKLL